MKIVAAVSALGAAAGGLLAQPPPAVDAALRQIGPEAIRDDMRVLADDRLEGRRPGTSGYDLAARYVADRFESIGLKPLFDGRYFQQVPLRRAEAIEGDTTLTFSRASKRAQLVFARDFVTSGDVHRETFSVTAPVVFAGFAVAAAELGYDDYAGVDVRGKVVAFLPGQPSRLGPAPPEWFAPLDVRVEAAIERGAVGMLFLAPDDSFPWETSIALARHGTTSWMRAADEPSRPSRPMAFGVLSVAAARELFRLGSRDFAGTASRLNAGERQSFDLPVTVSFAGRSRHVPLDSPNVGAVLPGSDPRLRQEYVVYTAHLDHLGRGKPMDGDDIYNGAIDNASGVAALLSIARAFAAGPEPPRRSILFLSTTAEESGGVGSDYFMTHPPVAAADIVAAINIDAPTLMRYPPYSVSALGAGDSTLRVVAEQAARQLGLRVKPAPMAFRSDSLLFILHGVPALRLIDGVETDRAGVDREKLMRDWIARVYHTPRDDTNQPLDFDALVTHAQMNFLIGYQVAQEPGRPRWNPGDFLGRRFGRGRDQR